MWFELVLRSQDGVGSCRNDPRAAAFTHGSIVHTPVDYPPITAPSSKRAQWKNSNCLGVSMLASRVHRYQHRHTHTPPQRNPQIPSPSLHPPRRNLAAVNRSTNGPRHNLPGRQSGSAKQNPIHPPDTTRQQSIVPSKDRDMCPLEPSKEEVV